MQQRTTTREEYLKRVNQVIEYINNHLGDDIDLNQLAEMSHLSPYHFHRVMSAFLESRWERSSCGNGLRLQLICFATRIYLSGISLTVSGMVHLLRCRRLSGSSILFHLTNIETIKSTRL